jgi:hypothetical protein
MTRLLAARLKHLLADSDRRVCILLGAGVSVPSVRAVPELTRQARAFADRWQGGSVSPPAPSGPVGMQEMRIRLYVEAMRHIQQIRGMEGVRAFVQRACLNAYNEQIPAPLPDRPMSDDAFRELVADIPRWRVPGGLSILADIIKYFPGNLDPYIVTTNFDPLMEIALRRVGVQARSVAIMDSDAVPVPMRLSEATATVLHLHGDAQSHTVHSPWVIGRPRPQLEAWLQEYLQGASLLVVGNSGFDEMIKRAIRGRLAADDVEGVDRTEVLWPVYEDLATHPVVDPELAEFFDSHRLTVTPYYGVDRDDLFFNLHELLSPSKNAERAPAQSMGTNFYELTRTLNSDFDFGISGVAPSFLPGFVFWPHRVRPPHIIHGVHALTAVMLSKLDIPVELHLDDSEMERLYAEQVTEELTEAVNAWFDACGAPNRPAIFRVSGLLDESSTLEVESRLWRLAREWYAPEISTFDALAAAKVVDPEADSVALTRAADRVLRQLYTWFALEQAIERHARVADGVVHAVTLGGADEHKMWDLWRRRSGTHNIASVYVPRLETPTLGRPDLWKHSDLRRDAPFAERDLGRLLFRLAQTSDGGVELKWLFSSAVRLATTAGARAEARIHDGRTLGSWYDVQQALRADSVGTSTALAQAISAWFHHGR